MPILNINQVKFDEDDGIPIEQVKFDEPDSQSSSLTRPLKAQALKAAEAVNRGLGSFSENLDEMSKYIADKTGMERGGAFEKAAEFYADNAQYWHDKAEKVGTNIVDDLIGEAVGGAVPGISEFMLNVPYAALLGAAKAKKEGNSEAMGAITEGAKRFVMGKILHAANVLKQPGRSAAMGGVFGAQTALEGGSPEDIAKGVGTGMLYGLPGKGQVGLREVFKKQPKTIPTFEPEVVYDPKLRELPPAEQAKALPKPEGVYGEGPGFTMRPTEAAPDVMNRAARPVPESTGEMVGDVLAEYKPILSRKGPYRTEETARKAMNAKGLVPEAFDVRPYGDGFAIYGKPRTVSPLEPRTEPDIVDRGPYETTQQRETVRRMQAGELPPSYEGVPESAGQGFYGEPPKAPVSRMVNPPKIDFMAYLRGDAEAKRQVDDIISQKAASLPEVVAKVKEKKAEKPVEQPANAEVLPAPKEAVVGEMRGVGEAIREPVVAEPVPAEPINQPSTKLPVEYPVVAKEPPAAAPKPSSNGWVFYKGQQLPFTDPRPLKVGRNKGKVEVVIRGKKRIVEEKDIKKWPEAKTEELPERTADTMSDAIALSSPSGKEQDAGALEGEKEPWRMGLDEYIKGFDAKDRYKKQEAIKRHYDSVKLAHKNGEDVPYDNLKRYGLQEADTPEARALDAYLAKQAAAREVESRTEAPLASVQGEGMEAKGGVPQAIEVDGLKIYPTTIKGKSRWAVQSPGNKGTDKFHGDTLHATQQEAMDYAKVVARQEADKINRENAQSAAKEAEQRKKNEIDSDDIRGFVSDKSPMHKGRVRKTLDKKYNFGDDGIMTVRQRVEKLYDDGNLKLSTFEESKIKPMSRTQYNRATGREQEAHEKKMREAGTKTVYLVNNTELGKTGYDYAAHLLKTGNLDKQISDVAIDIDEQKKATDRALKKGSPALSEAQRKERIDETVRSGEKAGVSDAGEGTAKPAVKKKAVNESPETLETESHRELVSEEQKFIAAREDLQRREAKISSENRESAAQYEDHLAQRMPKGKRAAIKIKTWEGMEETPATVYGDWAINTSEKWDKSKQYSVTHVKSGQRAQTYDSIQHAKRAISALHDAKVKLADDIKATPKYEQERLKSILQYINDGVVPEYYRERRGGDGSVTLGSGLGGLQPHYEKAVKKVADAIASWKEKSKIPFVTHTRSETGKGRPDTRTLKDIMDDLGIKGERRNHVISEVTGRTVAPDETIKLTDLSKGEQALLKNFLKNVSVDVYGKAMLQDVADYRGTVLSPKFIENAPNFTDIPKWSIHNITSWRIPDLVDASKELYKHTIARYEDSNNALRAERDDVNRKMRELMPGVSKGSKVSAMLQDYAEGKITLDQIPTKYRYQIMKTTEYTRKQYDNWLERVNEARELVGKKPIFRRSDYFTHGQEISELSNFFGGAERIPNEIAANSQFTHPNSPFFKYEKRLGGQYEADGIGNFMKYRDNALRVIHFTPAIVEAKAYIRHIPPNAHEAMMGWVDETMVGKVSPIDRTWDRIVGHGSRQVMSWTRTRMVKNIILGSARILVQQPSTFANTFAALATGKARNARDVANNITDAFVGFENAFTKSGKHILAESREYRDRLYIDDIDPSLLNKTEKALAYLNGHLDRFMVSNAYLGKYRQLMRQGMPHEEAVIEADKFAKMTQASYQKGNLNAIMRSETGKNVLPIQTFTFNVMNHLAYDVPKMIKERGKAATFAYGLTLLAGIAAVNAAYQALGMRETWDFMSAVPGLGYIKYGASGPLGVMYALAQFAAGDERAQAQAAMNLKKLPWQALPPFGGEQLRKSIDGILTNQDPSRKPYSFKNDWERLLAVVFGPGSTPSGREFWEKRDKNIIERVFEKDSRRPRRSSRSARRRRD